VKYSHFFCDIFTPWRRPTERWANLIIQFVQRRVHGSLQKWDYQLQMTGGFMSSPLPTQRAKSS
jgi:hypothetical protein